MKRLLDDKVKSIDAINNLVPGSAYKLEKDGKTFMYFRNKAGLTQPTEAEIDAEIVILQAEYDAQQYARDRQSEYPSIQDQLDYIYHNSITKWKSDMIKPVKDAHPKP